MFVDFDWVMWNVVNDLNFGVIVVCICVSVVLKDIVLI